MACSNCYNGCSEIVSDKCVKYTGIDYPVFGIQTGDSLLYVEQVLADYLASVLNGAGIKITIDPADYCLLVTKYLPECGDITALDLFKALVKAACDLQEQVDAIDATLTTLNADYTIECLEGVTSSSDTHAIVQAIINKLCALDIDLAALALDVDTNYVKLSELNTLIQAYLDSIASSKWYLKMVPYAALPFYGSISGKFDMSGAGYGDWEKIYICNGLNGTPVLPNYSIMYIP